MGAEVVVYDPVAHTAHCLNPTAALVFAAADGRTGVADLAERLSRETGVEVDEEVVWSAVAQLTDAGLFDASLPPRRPGCSRRRAMRELALGAAALTPLVLSLVVPTPAEAAATCIQASSCDVSNFGQPCYVVSSSECASKVCTGNPGECL